MVAEMARDKGIPVIDSFTIHRVTALESSLPITSNPNYIDASSGVANFITPYLLLGLYAEKYPANLNTDIAFDFLISQAKHDGAFLAEAIRVPLESGDIHLTSMAIRAIQLYASPAKKTHIDELVARTKQFLEKSNPTEQQELAFQLLGIHWCGSRGDQKLKVAEKLRSIQHEYGGWSLNTHNAK
jgi:hypothetical protein